MSELQALQELAGELAAAARVEDPALTVARGAGREASG